MPPDEQTLLANHATGTKPGESSNDGPVAEDWVKDWFGRLDRGSRYEAIQDLRLTAEKLVVSLNKDLGLRFKEFSKAILELHALREAGESPENLEERVQRARSIERELREMEAGLDHTRKEFAAFEHMEREVNRLG